MQFADHQEVVATLVSVTIDIDGSQHLIYDKIEWSRLPHVDIGAGCCYASGEELVSCVASDSTLKSPVNINQS
jgi:hypothetical protein